MPRPKGGHLGGLLHSHPTRLNECKRMFGENPSVSRVARILEISWSTANKAIFNESSAQAGMQ